MQRAQNRHTNKKRNDPLRSKAPSPPTPSLPPRNKERINERRQIDQDRVKSDNTHTLQRVTINHISRDGRIPHLNPRRKDKKRNLAHHPMVALIDRNAPQYQPDRRQQRSRIRQPQSHLRHPHAAIPLSKPFTNNITQRARAENLTEKCTQK